MHLANEVPSQGTTGGNHLPDYALTADLLAERTLDGLLAEHPGELVRTGKIMTTCAHKRIIFYTYIRIYLI